MPDKPPPEPDDATRVPAYILAGGRSVRFGSDKARALVGGEPLIRRVADGLGPVASSVTAVAQEADAYADLGLGTIADTAPDRGPVQGLLAALLHRLETTGPGWLLLAACDMLPADAIGYTSLLDARDLAPNPTHAIARRTDRWHPMPGLYHTALLPLVAAYLADDGRSFQGLLNKPGCHADSPPGGDTPPTFTLHANTPDDLHVRPDPAN